MLATVNGESRMCQRRNTCRARARAHVWSVLMCQDRPEKDRSQDLCLRCASEVIRHTRKEGFAYWTLTVQVRPYRHSIEPLTRSWGAL